MKSKSKILISSIAAIIAASLLAVANNENNNQDVLAAITKSSVVNKRVVKPRRQAKAYAVKNKPVKNVKTAKKPVKAEQTKAARGGSGDVLKPKVGTRPQDNLYLAVNSKWMKKAKIPADAVSTGSTDEISLKVNRQLRQDMADFADGKKPLPNIPNFDKAVELYKLARDIDKRNNDGAAPIKADLAKLEGIKDFADFNAKAADLYNNGMDLPLDLTVSPDMKNAQKNALYFSSAGTFLPDTSSYKDPNSQKLLAVLKKQSIDLLKLAGVSETDATTYAENALKFDGILAKNVKSAEQNADVTSQYNPMSIQNFKAKFTNFDIQQFLKGTVGKEPDQIIVTDPKFLTNINQVINQDNFAALKGWLIVDFINGAAGELSQKFIETAFPFSQAIGGQAKLPSTDKQAFSFVNGDFGELIGIYYGQTYFGADAKKDVTNMVNKILQTYESRLQNNTWLSKATKEKAIDKLKSLVVKVGYPDEQSGSYKNIQITPASQGGTLYGNDQAMTIESIKENLAQLFKPVNRNIWAMSGAEVNAAYNPQVNDVTLPAAILQAPFYSKTQSRAANWGGIGTVIGHEISHAFDNNGAQFDKYGNLHNWWTQKDYTEFKKRIKAEDKLFNGIKYAGTKIKGKQIVSENVADLGGLTVALQVAKSEGDNLRELFENNARIWRLKATPQAIKTILAVDVHAPNPLRANVQAQCQDDFYKVFKVKSSDGMWLDPKKRIQIW
ncbi:M13 family metallopeptidase [Lactobacillus sp. ESL0791]|uniref:M13 family metallopeptidase n=1 Tax=Lactobacillus sp. ESL0791 TaxID=2983234 RepID=UPI0023F6FA90|nr:M13 family metallopeptidase [Lactobacillus sp. ESL0791]MDF7639504.1 M13 family metallopeptidase [Lactobacillus sp. ESL0791]